MKKSENKHTVIVYTDKSNKLLRFIWLRLSSIWKTNVCELFEPFYIFIMYSDSFFRTIRGLYYTQFHRYSRLFFQKVNRESWPGTWRSRGYVPLKEIIKCEFLRLKIFFSSYIHTHNCCYRFSLRHIFSYCRKYSLSKDFSKFKNFF